MERAWNALPARTCSNTVFWIACGLASGLLWLERSLETSDLTSFEDLEPCCGSRETLSCTFQFRFVWNTGLNFLSLQVWQELIWVVLSKVCIRANTVPLDYTLERMFSVMKLNPIHWKSRLPIIRYSAVCSAPNLKYSLFFLLIPSPFMSWEVAAECNRSSTCKVSSKLAFL